MIEFLYTHSKRLLQFRLSKSLLKISYGRQIRGMKRTNSLDCFKLISFILCFLCQTAYVVPFNQINDIWSAVNNLNSFDVSIATSLFCVVENFFTISVYLGTQKCIKAMRENNFSIKRFYLVKVRRLAIIYYPVWLLLYVYLPRIAEGPSWYFALMNTNEHCRGIKNTWPTLLFMGNIIPHEITPFKGCFQEAWPFQIDLQLYIFIPILSYIYLKFPKIAIYVCTGIVVLNYCLLFNQFYSY